MKLLKLLTLILIFSYTFYFQVGIAGAQEGEKIHFRPNIHIPGMDNFLEGGRPVSSTNPDLGYEYVIDGESIPKYISAVYSYAAILAGVVAMFMLVFAAFQWLLAAGNAEKIGRARETISGALLGLTLLFGGNLLLSQISNRLVNLEPVVPADVKPKSETCKTDADCESEVFVCIARFYDPGFSDCRIGSRGALMTIVECPTEADFLFADFAPVSDCYCGKRNAIGEKKCVDYDPESGPAPNL